MPLPYSGFTKPLDKLLFGQQGWQPMRYQLIHKSTLMTNARQPTTR